MWKFLKGSLVIVLIVLVLVVIGKVVEYDANNETRAVQIGKLGLVGEHQLKRKPTGATVILGFGSFLLASGSAQLTSQPAITFYWGRVESEIIPTTLPLSMFRILIDESKNVPTVEFVFDQRWLNSRREAYSESEKTNLNWWLDPEMIRDGLLKVVIVRISSGDLEKEKFLPK